VAWQTIVPPFSMFTVPVWPLQVKAVICNAACALGINNTEIKNPIKIFSFMISSLVRIIYAEREVRIGPR